MCRLYPRLEKSAADALANDYFRKELDALSSASGHYHPQAPTAETGGTPITRNELETLRNDVVTFVQSLGFPEESSPETRRTFDVEIGKLLHQRLNINLGEACRDDIWAFVGCVLLPDCVAWRFPNKPRHRFTGGVRNTFQRLWWRATVLHDEDSDDPYHLLALPEDALVQIMERTSMMADWRLSKLLAKQIKSVYYDNRIDSRQKEGVWRDATKRVRQRTPITNLMILEDAEINEILTDCFNTSIRLMDGALAAD